MQKDLCCCGGPGQIYVIELDAYLCFFHYIEYIKKQVYRVCVSNKGDKEAA